MFEVVYEVLHEVFVEITADPSKFAIEVAQFLLLAGIVYFVAVGIGKRKGMVVNILAERRERVTGRVERAAHADEELARSLEAAAVRVATAKAEAVAIVREARATSRKLAKQTRATTDAEAAEIRARAVRLLEEERAEMHVEIRDRLVGVVAQSTRAMLNEGVSPHEQRQLIQGIMSSEIGRLEQSAERLPATVLL
jgi:F0F1-type ATP synthase membrane subunit b/b'